MNAPIINVIGISQDNNTAYLYIGQELTEYSQGNVIENLQAALNASQATGNDLYRSSSIDNHIVDELPSSTEIDELFNY